MPTARARTLGVVIAGFGLLYAALAVRPSRVLLIASTIAKASGALTGVVYMLRGRRDVITLVSLADAAWLPGFVCASTRTPR